MKINFLLTSSWRATLLDINEQTSDQPVVTSNIVAMPLLWLHEIHIVNVNLKVVKGKYLKQWLCAESTNAKIKWDKWVKKSETEANILINGGDPTGPM